MGSLVGKYEYKACSRGKGWSICLLGRESRRKRENCREVLKIWRERAGGGGRAVRLEALRGMKTLEFCFQNSVPLRIEFMRSFHTDDVVSPNCKEERDYRFLFFSILFFSSSKTPCFTLCVCVSDALVWVDETFMNREPIGLVQQDQHPSLYKGISSSIRILLW